MTSKQIELGKQNINDFLKNQELLFFGQENLRMQNVKFPFYDGGLTPIVIYYVQKFKIPMKFDDSLKNIKGSTLFQITNNFYGNYINKLELKYDTFDLFGSNMYSDNFLKNYYFYNKFYDFEIAVYNFREIYEKKKKIVNFDGSFDWYNLIPNMILGLLAIRENVKIGLKDQSKLPLFENFIKITVEEYLKTVSNKITLQYLTNFWLYQLLEPKSKVIQEIGIELVLDLIKLKKNNPDKLWVIDKDNEFRNYFINWIIYGIIKDYLNNPVNNDLFYKKYTLNDLSKDIVYEGFKNKSDDEEDDEEDDEDDDYFEDKDQDQDENQDKDIKKKDIKSKESFENTLTNENNRPKLKKRDKVPSIEKPLWKLLLYCIIFGIFLYISIKGIIFFWTHILHFSKNNFNKYFNKT
jgi:hypothetical protein